MNDKQVKRARALFEKAVLLSGSARKDFLDSGCGEDRELRSALGQMLQADEQLHPLLDRSFAWRSTALSSGSRIGSYRILRELGTGGMGSVYLAELSDDPSKGPFALKVVRWISPDLLRRFYQEQEILRGLHHENIACFLDAGITEEGSPYLVMEYVDGDPLHTYCDRHLLSIDARIALFRQVCAAVRYMHQHLIVHRDLKPANILVTADGKVKLLDFGVAKLLQPASGDGVTNTSYLMTPDYASPEQIRGEAISTLTDVYALGVVLYELLSGTRPFHTSQQEFPEILRQICEDEPVKPSAAKAISSSTCRIHSRDNVVSADLDNIVMKALQKQPQRRYVSVEQFDEDLQRYQSGLPVIARGDSLSYRTVKFVRRNGWQVAAVMAIVLTLLAGVIATSLVARIAKQQAFRAEKEAREAQYQRGLAQAGIKVAEQLQRAAEEQLHEAQRQKQNSERRLTELQRLTNGAVDLYRSSQVQDAFSQKDTVAIFLQNSLLTLRNEAGLRSDQANLLDKAQAEVQSSILGREHGWHLPAGWYGTETQANEYRVGVDKSIRHSGHASLFLRSLSTAPHGHVLAWQNFNAASYRTKRVCLSGFFRVENVVDQVIFRLAVLDTQGNFLDSDQTNIFGTSTWKWSSIVLDVPATASSIRIQIGLSGRGTVWVDDLSFHEVSAATPLSKPQQPQNLDFKLH